MNGVYVPLSRGESRYHHLPFQIKGRVNLIEPAATQPREKATPFRAPTKMQQPRQQKPSAPFDFSNSGLRPGGLPKRSGSHPPQPDDPLDESRHLSCFCHIGQVHGGEADPVHFLNQLNSEIETSSRDHWLSS